jgi:hypothetical protein
MEKGPAFLRGRSLRVSTYEKNILAESLFAMVANWPHPAGDLSVIARPTGLEREAPADWVIRLGLAVAGDVLDSGYWPRLKICASAVALRR